MSAKTDGTRNVKVTGKKLLNEAKLKVGLDYNPWNDMMNLSTEVDFKKSPVHATVGSNNFRGLATMETRWGLICLASTRPPNGFISASMVSLT